MATDISPPGNRRLENALRALPEVGKDNRLLDHKAALAAFFKLKKLQPNLSKDIELHLDELVTAALQQLEAVPGVPNAYALRVDELRSLLAGAAILGAMQAAYDVGVSLQEREAILKAVEEIFIASGGLSDGGAGSTPAA